MKKILPILVLALSLVGCGSDILTKLVQTPEVKGIQLSSFSMLEKRAVFEVALYNPNSFPIPISGISGDIQLNEQNIGSLQAQSAEQLGALATQNVTVPLTLDADALMGAAKSVLLKRKAEYRFNGTAETSVGGIPFTKSGDLSVQEIITSLLRAK